MARLRSVRALVIAGVVVAIVAAGLAVASGSDHQQQLPSVPATVDIKTLENHIRDAKKRAAGTDYAGKAKSAANKVVKHQDVVKRRARDIVNDVVQAVMKAHGRRFRVQNAVSDDADLLNTGCLRESAFTSALTSLQSSCVADFDYLTKDDLSGICDTSCFKAIREKLSPFKACLAKNGLLSLVEVVDKCNSARECFSDEYVSKIKNIPVHCVAQMQAAFDFANNTGAAKAMAAEFCSSGCKDRLLDIAQKFPTCAYELGDLDAAARVKAVTDFMAHVCTSADDNSAVCAVQLKMLGNLKCRGDSSSSSSSAAPCADADGWCDLGTCEPAPAQSRLAALCGNCLGGLRRFFEAQHDVYTVAALDMTCATADVTAIGGDSNHAVPYCLAALPDAFGRVAAAGGDAATSQDQHRAVCSGATRSCLERVVHRLADAEERQAYDRLGTCSKETLSCESDFQAQMQKAYDMREDLKAFCTLDSNTGTYCIPLIRNFVSKTQCARDDKCSTECRNDFEAATTEAGCCASELDAALIKDDVMRRRMPFARLRVVDRIYDIASQKVHRRANFVRVGNTFRDDRSTMAANDFAACAGNTTGFWGKFESTCSSSGGSSSGANAKVQREAEPTVGPAPDLIAVKIAPGADPTSGGVNARKNANQ